MVFHPSAKSAPTDGWWTELESPQNNMNSTNFTGESQPDAGARQPSHRFKIALEFPMFSALWRTTFTAKIHCCNQRRLLKLIWYSPCSSLEWCIENSFRLDS
jgi:hypothetical protein